ncbi:MULTISPECIES: N-acetylmuramoyl-L-alanine amidase [Streptomyces]|uniref:N-acetylmuramoyl-L-alanine amidase n=1 Tax=Streptomyces solicathayae TaxID=3081768 RepID=A0ABZ0LPD2_9ACTN|nr:N-acetylmuramoyl-L-alanine amidase [Streptomyces sp. HUAS YS2]WOX21372.1 N-acetylmuramoyl-L-alanine amidase [Streptomyces sp. HUAS YS2]
MKRRRVWGTAIAVAAGLSGVVVFGGMTGNADGEYDGKAAGGPVDTKTRSVKLKTVDGGRSASLARQDTEPFSMLGVTWADPAARMPGTVEARTRGAESGDWSRWVELDDLGTPDPTAERGGTEPVWFGSSDGVEVRVVAGGKSTAVLPSDLRLTLVDPGRSGGTPQAMAPAAFAVEGEESATPTAPAPEPGTESPAPEPAPSETPTTGAPTTAPETTEPAPPAPETSAPETASPSASAPATATPSPSATGPTPPPSTAARPAITSRAGWGADESMSPEAPTYLPGGKIKAVAVHHTAATEDYSCADSAAIVRGIYAYHVKPASEGGNGWKDIGYHFLVDKCGTIFEGRKGGVDLPVVGAHTYGFNSETTSISLIGGYTTTTPSKSQLISAARIAAWKLGQYGVDPAGTTTLTAGDVGTNYYGKSWAKGTQVPFSNVFGHRDGFNTQCPGQAAYNQLPSIRSWAAGPVAGLRVTSVTGATQSAGTYYTRGPLTVAWTSTTPSSFIIRHEVLIDGNVVATATGSATSAAITVPAGRHSVAVRAVHTTRKLATTPALAVVGDTTAPVFSTTPRVYLRPGTVDTTAVPLNLVWKATDAAALRDVRLTTPVPKVYGPTVTTAAHTAKSAVATMWTLNAYDQAGNRTTASVGSTPVILQETSAVRSGTWTAKSSAGYLGGKSLSSGSRNASLSWTFTGRSAAWVVSRATTSGQAYVYVDGVKIATVDLKSSTTKYRDAIWTRSWSSAAKHTVKIVVVGTSGRPTVTSDGLVYLR